MSLFSNWGDGNPLVSVIIPVYNAEEYLIECVLSVTGQTYRNLEILLIDDGSTDMSSEICEELASEDHRIKVFHKENEGAAESRNCGIREANGEWLAFVDSDDVLSKIYIEALLTAAIETGTPLASFAKPCAFGERESLSLIERYDKLPPARIVDTEEMLELTFYQEFETGPTTKIYHKSVLDVGIFPKGNYFEDLASIYKIIDKCSQVAILDTSRLYGYRINEGSKTSAPFSRKKADDILKTTSEMYGYISTRHPRLVPSVSSRCFSACRAVFAQLPTSHGEAEGWKKECDRLWGALKKYRVPIISDPKSRGREKFAVAVSYLGKGVFSAFCQLARRLKLMR